MVWLLCVRHLCAGQKGDPCARDRAALAASVGKRLHFAGEACHLAYPSTVHGALLSGREAATRVLGALGPATG